MTTLMDSPSYKLADLVLSQEKPFTLGDIYDKLKEESDFACDKGEIKVKKYLERLRDNGIIIEHGSFYSLSIDDF